MKFNPLIRQETCQEWFGKAGIPWHGGMVIMKHVPQEGDEDDASQDDYDLLFFDYLTNHKTEDGFSVLNMVEGMNKFAFNIVPAVLFQYIFRLLLQEFDTSAVCILLCGKV